MSTQATPSSPTFDKSTVVEVEEGKNKTYLYIPDTMDAWPWPRKMNPYYLQVTAESDAWLKSLKPFTPESQYAFDKGDFGRLAALVYPDISRDAFRTGVDLMNVLFVLDEYTDVAPPHVVREMVDIVIDALYNPDKPRPEGEIVLGELTRQFWARGRATATPEAAKHFKETFTEWLHSVITQAQDRDNVTVHTMESYLNIRRLDVGVRQTFMPGELHLSLPDEAYYHPVIKELENLVVDLVILDNDIASYNREQARGDKHNILFVSMVQHNTDFDGAMAWVVDFHKEIETRFHDTLTRVPSFGPEVDAQLQEYIDLLSNWPRGNYCWNFEGGRYFGSKGLEYQRTRLVPLLPKRIPQIPTTDYELVQVQLID